MSFRLRAFCMLLGGFFVAIHSGAGLATEAAPAQQVRDFVESVRQHGGARSGDVIGVDEAVARFYEGRALQPVWTPSLRRAVAVEFAKLKNDGLDPACYGVRELQAAAAAVPAEELELTRQLLRALGDLHRGVLDRGSLKPRSGFGLPAEDPDLGIAAVADAVARGDTTGLFNRARPSQWMYRNMQLALARLYAIDAQGGWPQLSDGEPIKPGAEDDRVPQIRRRLVISGDLPKATAAADSRLYDSELQWAVLRFQSAQALNVDAVIGTRTVAQMNVPVAARIEQARANLERGRWLLRRAQGDFVLVDVAGYRVSLYRDSKQVWQSRVQVGKPYRKTPIFDSKIDRITLNPSWTIPPTILREDIVPKARRNPKYLAEQRIRVLDGQGREVAPAKINWAKASAYTWRQDPGDDNSLGRAVIRFANSYNVYMHDTPHQAQFDNDQRTFSSGCIRVERARELVERLLDDPQQWNRAALDAALTQAQTREVNLQRPVPVLIAYWTMEADARGRASFRDDVYERDGDLIAALQAARNGGAR